MLVVASTLFFRAGACELYGALQRISAEQGQHQARRSPVIRRLRLSILRRSVAHDGCLLIADRPSMTSLRPELAAIDRVLQTVDIAEDLLILSDCQTALTEIQKWIGEGLRPCMAVTKDSCPSPPSLLMSSPHWKVCPPARRLL